MFTRLVAALAATIALAGGLVATAPAASAAARNGVCESGEFCLYYNSGNAGSLVDLTGSQRDYGTGAGCVAFVSGGSGQGQCVKNNTASVWNRTSTSVTVFYNSDFGGVFQRIASLGKGDLAASVKNNNASQVVGDSSLRFPLSVTQAQITSRSTRWCYTSDSNCHHDYNAADIFAATGTSVLAPVDGTVQTVNVRAARSDCTSVGSSVTVKDRFGRLWYFAHMDDSPGPVVTPGQTVTKGQRLGYVGTNNHALCTPSHLHIDMRVGVDSRVSCSGAACASYGFVNNQPLLREAFGKLAAS